MLTVKGEWENSGRKVVMKDTRARSGHEQVMADMEYVAKHDLVIIDEIDGVPPGDIFRLAETVLRAGKTLLVTNHLGSEDNGEIYRQLCKQCHLPHTRIRMVSRDRRDSGTRITSWFDGLKHIATDKTPSLAESISGITIEKAAAQRVGYITACRPYEASCLISALLTSVTGNTITEEEVDRIWQTMSPVSSNSRVGLWHEEILRKLAEIEAGIIHNSVEEKSVRLPLKIGNGLKRDVSRVYDLIGLIAQGQEVSPSVVVSMLGNTLTNSGLGLIRLDSSGRAEIVGEWLATDWRYMTSGYQIMKKM